MAVELGRPAESDSSAALLPAGRADELERLTRERGEALLQAVRGEQRRGGAEWLYNYLIGLTTADEALKVELFRFVDALPALKTPRQVSQHLSEYLGKPGLKLPPGALPLLALMGRTAPTERLLAFAAQTGARMMARCFIAGADAREATGAVERLRRRNMAFTLDLLGEAVTSEAEALVYQAKYLDLLRDLTPVARRWPVNPQIEQAPWGELPRVNVSIKLSSLYARFDPMASEATARAVKERLRPILRLARECGAFVNFDMEQHDFCALTNHIFREVFEEDEFRNWPDVGIVTQAYLRQAERDLITLCDWARARGTPIWVRLVKGAYWDYETIIAAQRGHPSPAFSRKSETDANFERLTQMLIENWETLRPAIATHNVRSAARAQAVAETHGLPARGVEYQVLFGMGEPIGRALSQMGERVRVYVPFGELLPGMAYLVRRLLENTSNDSFIRSAGASVPVPELLAAPTGAPRIPAEATEVNGTAVMVRANGNLNTDATSGAMVRQSSTNHSGNHDGGESNGGAFQNGGAFRNEPETDFVLATNQQRMRAALDAVRERLGETVPLVIGGRREEPPGWERPDPSQAARIVSRVCGATPDHAQRAVQAAHEAFPNWRETPVAERADLLRRVADEFGRRRFEIAAWQVYEVGKPWREADADVAEAMDFCRFYAAEMERLAPPRRRDVPGEWNEYFYEARGPAVVIAPWNFPLAILTGMATAALVAGNTVMLKPSEQSSRVAYFLQEALEACGAPPGVCNFLPGDGEVVGPVLVNHPRVALIAFTGSKDVGLSILRDAAKVAPGQREIKRVVAELGGKNAIIVDDDADLDEAVLGVLASTIGYSGQKCSACSRAIIVGDAYQPFCARLREAVRSIHIGRADDPATTLGPLVDKAAQQRVLRSIETGKQEGRLLALVEPPKELDGFYTPAAVFTDCPPGGKLFQEEIFGPVLAVLQARDLDEALALADDSQYALTGGLYSRSPHNIARVRREMRVGNLYINRKITGALVDRQPFGGARMSGVGSKAGGPDYLLQFLVPRTITESVMRRGFAPSSEMSSEMSSEGI